MDKKVIPLIPLRDIIIFPHMVVPLFVGREKSINALERAMESDKNIFLSAQKQAKTDDPKDEDIFEIGTVGTILQMLKLPDGTVKVLVEGKRRARILGFVKDEEDMFLVNTEAIDEPVIESIEGEALVRNVVKSFENYIKLNKRVPPEMLASVTAITEPGKLADSIATHLTVKLSEKQKLLSILEPLKRLEHLYGMIEGEIEILDVEQRVRQRVKRQMEKTQKEYYLN
ncbi:MAG: LON peptidase substrate-binding domain-containing protein, partial [Deltaproteobacteria bacterium]|nr:LON peptidase substrate-binding domain-containing protein [Deltaproteobacteria bacterium]